MATKPELLTREEVLAHKRQISESRLRWAREAGDKAVERRELAQLERIARWESEA